MVFEILESFQIVHMSYISLIRSLKSLYSIENTRHSGCCCENELALIFLFTTFFYFDLLLLN